MNETIVYGGNANQRIKPFGNKRNGYHDGQPLKRRPKANNLRSHRANGGIRNVNTGR